MTDDTLPAVTKEEAFAALDTALSDENSVPREYQGVVRASSLPFCQRQYVLYRCTEISSVQETSFFGAACMEMGTALHSVTQAYLGRAGMLFGNWHCAVCGATYQDRRGPVLCCNEHCVYDEYSLSHACGITAHPDGVCLELPDGRPFRALLEFKGTGAKKLQSLKAPIWRHSSFQANFYLHLLNEQKGFGLEQILIVYIDRGVPSNRKYFLVRPNEAVYRNTIAAISEAKEKVRLRILPERICATPTDAAELRCPYQHVCFIPDQKLQEAMDAQAK